MEDKVNRESVDKFGHLLKVERTRLEISAVSVSEDLGITQAYVSKIEKSKGNTMIRYLLLLRKQGADLNSLFDKIQY